MTLGALPGLRAGRVSTVVATNFILLLSSQTHPPPLTRADLAAAWAVQLEVSRCLAWAPQGEVRWVLVLSVGDPCSETRVHVHVMTGAGPNEGAFAVSRQDSQSPCLYILPLKVIRNPQIIAPRKSYAVVLRVAINWDSPDAHIAT